VGVVVAIASALVNFAWLPYYPVWSILMIALAVAVIWALTVHGRDIAKRSGW
jgi:type III secretory pathway component EscV